MDQFWSKQVQVIECVKVVIDLHLYKANKSIMSHHEETWTGGLSI